MEHYLPHFLELQLLIHIEVQGGRSSPTALRHVGERMFRYFYRILDRYVQAHRADEAELFSLCILTAGAGGPPTLAYRFGYAGYGVQCSCPVIYLAKWLENWDELERLASKTRMARSLYQYRYSSGDFLRLMRLIDWLLTLSEGSTSPTTRAHTDAKFKLFVKTSRNGGRPRKAPGRGRSRAVKKLNLEYVSS